MNGETFDDIESLLDNPGDTNCNALCVIVSAAGVDDMETSSEDVNFTPQSSLPYFNSFGSSFRSIEL